MERQHPSLCPTTSLELLLACRVAGEPVSWQRPACNLVQPKRGYFLHWTPGTAEMQFLICCFLGEAAYKCAPGHLKEGSFGKKKWLSLATIARDRTLAIQVSSFRGMDRSYSSMLQVFLHREQKSLHIPQLTGLGGEGKYSCCTKSTN